MIQANSTLEFSLETSFHSLSCPTLNVAIFFSTGAYSAIFYISRQLITFFIALEPMKGLRAAILLAGSKLSCGFKNNNRILVSAFCSLNV